MLPVSRQILIIFFGAVTICASFFLWAPDDILNKPCGDCDGGGYLQVAENFLAGKGWTDNNGRFATTRPPGHALIIAALITIAQWTDAPAIYIFRMFNTLMIVTSSVLLLMIGRLVWQNKYIVFIPFVWMTSPFTLWFLNQSYSEMPFFTSFFGSLLLAIISFRSNGQRQYLGAFAVGIVSALSMMIKPIAVGMPIVYFITLLLTNSRMSWISLGKYLAALSLGVLLVVMPWTSTVYKKTGEIILLTNGKLAINSTVAGITFATDTDGDREKLHIPNRVKNLLGTIEEKLGINQGSIHRHKDQHALTLLYGIGKEMWDMPVAAIQFIGIKIARSWYGTYSHRNELITVVLQIFYLPAIILSLIRGIRWNLFPNDFLVLSLSVTLYYWGMSVLFEPLVRYMVPAIGVLYISLPALLWNLRSRNAQLS